MVTISTGMEMGMDMVTTAMDMDMDMVMVIQDTVLLAKQKSNKIRQIHRPIHAVCLINVSK
jgi:predicted peroxiredoxin